MKAHYSGKPKIHKYRHRPGNIAEHVIPREPAERSEAGDRGICQPTTKGSQR